MLTCRLRAIAFVACLLSGAVAHAVPVVYDFVGTGAVSCHSATGPCGDQYSGEFTGTITIDVLDSGPSGPSSYQNAVSA